jgi:RNA polymerase sigma-70 factor (ECF subfamily)
MRHGLDHITWPPSLPFELVLEQARALNPAYVSMLYRRFLPVVYRYALARVADIQAAEDITSETFSAMIEGIGAARARDELGFSAWLLGIARNQALLHFRRLRTRREVSADLPEEAEPAAVGGEDDPLAVLTARESWGVTVAALNRLTDEQRDVVLYRCVLDYSAEEVGTLLGKRAGAIRALQFRALASLARYLGIAEADAAEDGDESAAGRRGGKGHGPRR